MAHYRKVDTRIWNDAKFYELTPHAKLVFISILTHPNMTGLGVMRASEESLAADLNMVPKAFAEAFREVFRKGLIKVSERPPVILVPRFLKYNKPESPNVVRGWSKMVDMVPESDLLFEALDIAKANVCSMPKAFAEAFEEAFREVFRKTSLNQRAENREQRTENRKNPPLSPQGETDSGSVSETIEIPESLNREPFSSAWDEWVQHRRELRKTLKPTAITQQMSDLAPLGAERAAECLRLSIRNGWQGLFPERFTAGRGANAGMITDDWSEDEIKRSWAQ